MKTRTALVMVWLLLGAACLTADPTASTSSPLITSLAELTKPAKQIPFKEVIRATTHHRILDFDTNNTAHVALRSRILKAATLAGERARKAGLSAARANEAGNQMERSSKPRSKRSACRPAHRSIRRAKLKPPATLTLKSPAPFPVTSN